MLNGTRFLIPSNRIERISVTQEDATRRGDRDWHLDSDSLSGSGMCNYYVPTALLCREQAIIVWEVQAIGLERRIVCP